MSSAKNVLIKKSEEIIKLIKEVNNKPLQEIDEKSYKLNFESDIVPNYESAMFKLKNYS
jgi:hypothetical protein